MAEQKCPDCPQSFTQPLPPGARIKHHADGTHTFETPRRPRIATDPKPRGRPHA